MRHVTWLVALAGLAISGCAGPARTSAAEITGATSQSSADPNGKPIEPAKSEKPKAEAPPKREPPYFDETTDTWYLAKSDFSGVSSDEFTPYCRTVVDEEGRVLGIQIGDDAPADSILLRRGLKKGDIVRSINGVLISNVADVRRTVRELYNSGIFEFELRIDRDRQKIVMRCVVPKPGK